MRELFDKNTADAILQAAQQTAKAAIFKGSTEKPFEVQVIDLTLTTARDITNPFVLGFPFKSLYIAESTDVNVKISITPQTQDSYQSSIPMKQNDSLIFEEPMAKAFITWEAQTGKTVKILAFVSSEFRSGSQVSVSGGGVSISEGTSFTTARVDLTAATATAALASNGSRKVASIQNNTGAPVFLGNSSVSNTGTNLGYELPAGATFQWKNSSALYAYSVAGGTGDSGLLILEEI